MYNAVKYQRPADKYILIRVNGIYSQEIDEDLEAAVRAQPDAIRIPKVEYAREVQRIDEKITAIERKAGLSEGSIKPVSYTHLPYKEEKKSIKLMASRSAQPPGLRLF